MLEQITALILTYNEAPNIDRTLAKLRRIGRVVVIDSGSDDGTQAIVTRYGNAEIIARPFDTHAQQWTFGLAQMGDGAEWVLALDADYELSDELENEIAGLTPPADISGYWIRFHYRILGTPIRSGAYPPVVALYRRRRARYVQDGHTQRVVVDGRIATLKGRIYHDDRKSLSRWLDSQKAYARLEAEHLERGDRRRLHWRDRVRMMIGMAPILMFGYVYVIRGGVFDGRPGLYYAFQRSYAEMLLSLELLDRRLRRRSER